MSHGLGGRGGGMTFREKTTFVIGAGASNEFGLPVGSQLASLIKSSTRTLRGDGVDRKFADSETVSIVLETFEPHERDHAILALDKIHQSIHTAVSIDALVHRFNDPYVSRAAKAIIANLILRAERQCTLSKDGWDQFASFPDAVFEQAHSTVRNPDYTRIGQFFRILTDNVREPRDIGKELSIICFNYDRCIQFYLMKTISEAYQIPRAEALEIVEGINIIHPYGSLGRLAVQGQDTLEDRIAFGAEVDHPIHYKDVVGSIRTYTEQITDSEVVSRIHDAMSCNVLVFLGFGFNNQNLNLLRVDSMRTTPSAVYVSAYGFYKQVETTLVRRLSGLYDLTPRHDVGRQVQAGLEFGATASDLFAIHTPNLSSFMRTRFDPRTGSFDTPSYD